MKAHSVRFILPFCMILCLSIFIGCEDKEQTQQYNRIRQKVDSLVVETQQLRQAHARLVEEQGEQLIVGFEVQIGAFEYFDLSAYQEELVRFREVEDDGLKKYVLGRFRKFDDAENFLKDVKRIGVKDAFIAGIVHGSRTTVAEAQKASKTYYGF